MSLQAQIETAVVAVLQALDLDGVPAGNISRQLVPLDRDLAPTALPAVRVGPGDPERFDPKGGTNAADDAVHSVLVILVDRANQEPTAPSSGDDWLDWREQVALEFHHHRLDGVSDVYDCRVEPHEAAVPQAWRQNNLWVSAVELKFLARRLRT